MTALYQNRQVRDLEAYVINNQIMDEYQLMQNAGEAAWQLLSKRWPAAKHIIVCCAKGNNAGDGYVVARLAHAKKLQVTVYSLCELSELKGSAKRAATECVAAGVSVLPYTAETALGADVIVDALLGTGLKGEIKEALYLSCITAMNEAEIPILALDVPSGVNVDNGNIHGVAVKASATITFIALKQGLFTAKAPAYCGKIECADLDLPAKAFHQVAPTAELLQWENVKKHLPRRSRISHKGDYGHVLVIGGDYGMGGAVRMAAEAAMRVGAGLVSVATRPEHVSVVNSSRPEIMCHQVNSAVDLEPLLQKVNVIVIGPGLGKSDWAKSLLERVLVTDKPKVLDADALNLLSQNAMQSSDWVLTPHPGEAARLLEIKSQAIQTDRFVAAQKLQMIYGGVVVLKGVGTIVQGESTIPKICPAGNPGMASGGMGDILSGVIGGLLAQGLNKQQAAEVGVLIHSMAADLAAVEGGERGLLATDLIRHLRELVNPI